MGIQELVREIQTSGEAEARRVRERADQEAAAILREAQGEAEKAREILLARARDEAEAVRRRVLASAQLDAKKLRLAAEADVLTSVHEAAKQKIGTLSAAERATLTKALVKAAHRPSGGRAWLRADDKALLHELGLEFGGDLKGLGGIIIEDPSGETREDLRFETVLDETWRAVVRDVATDLFGA